ncbi:MAG: hypothetical protein IT385_11275 [Deltaproteobacteria bacterium]|nr:hypothetical protein [Deltaproteobacteria bacterium]
MGFLTNTLQSAKNLLSGGGSQAAPASKSASTSGLKGQDFATQEKMLSPGNASSPKAQGGIAGWLGNAIEGVKKAATESQDKKDAEAKKPDAPKKSSGPVLDSKNRELPSFWSQAVQIDGRLARLRKLQPNAMPSVTIARTANDLNGTPTHYNVSDPFYMGWYGYPMGGSELGYFDTIAHLDKRLKDAGWTDAYSWLPSGAPKAMKEDLAKKAFTPGERWAKLYESGGEEYILWVDDSGAQAAYEMMMLPRTDRETYEKAAAKKGHSDRVADILWTAGLTANQDYKDLVLCRKLSPTQARNQLEKLGKDLTLLMAKGMYGIMGPSANVGGGSYGALVDAALAGFMATKPDFGIPDIHGPQSSLDDKQHASDPGPGHYWDDEYGTCG